MPKVEIYTTNSCPYCSRSKNLLTDKGVEFTEYGLEGNRDRMREMLKRCRQKTVPQIFIDNNHIGGFEELADLESAGQLDQLLGDAAYD
ncbi:MAG: glutaredoxin 3 [Chromatiales bacterium]|nr:glutaredoxin 3 [Chromatiales bacterium]